MLERRHATDHLTLLSEEEEEEEDGGGGERPGR